MTTASLFAEPATPERKPVVLGAPGHQMAARLAQQGFAFDALPHPGLDGVPLTWEKARQYNVIMLSGLGAANADMTLAGHNRETLATLRRFLEAGGGILFFPEFGQIVAHKPPQDEFLKPLGLTPLFDEQVFDSDSAMPDSALYPMPYALAGQVFPSPVTAGVKNLWYPVPTGRPGAQLHTIPFVADGSWTVAVKGAKSSHTKRGPLQEACTEPGSYASEVPLVAVREVGKGRIVYIASVIQYLYSSAAVHSLGSVALDKGLRGVPSDGYRLVENALTWLAEPSLAQGEPGGAAGNPALLRNPSLPDPAAPPTPPFDWSGPASFRASHPASVGSIGARTTFSSGKADPGQWVEAAKAQGLDYLVFLEEFASLTAEEFEALREECRRLTTSEFTAIPGFTIDDEVGHHYFYLGWACPILTRSSSPRTARSSSPGTRRWRIPTPRASSP